MALSYDNPDFRVRADNGKHDWWRYLITVVWSFFIQVVLVVILFVVCVFAGVPIATLMQATKDPSLAIWFFAIVGASFGAWSIGIWSGARLFNAKPLSDYLAGWRWPLFLAGAVIWFLVCGGDAVLDYVLQPAGFTLKNTLTPAIVAVTVVSIAIQTFTEEFVFRGYATQGILHLVKKPIPAAILSGLLFGACHIPNGWLQAINATVLGIVLALIAIKTGNLAFGYGVHLVNNLLGAIVVVSADDVFKGAPGLFAQHTPALDGLDLGVSIAGLVVLCLVFGFRPRKT